MQNICYVQIAKHTTTKKEAQKENRTKTKGSKEKAQSETGHTVENYPWVKMQ